MAFNRNLPATAPAPLTAFDVADALAMELCGCPWTYLTFTQKLRIRAAVLVLKATNKI